MKRLLALITVLLLLQISLSAGVSAHDSSHVAELEQVYNAVTETYQIGNEEIGWILNENFHVGRTSIEYRFRSVQEGAVPEYIKPMVRNAFGVWSDIVTMTETESFDDGSVACFNDPDSATTSRIREVSNDEETGHIEAWILLINLAYPVTEKDIAHEVGHLLGLNDLNSIYNSNKVMYFNSGDRSGTPSTEEKWGAKIMLGIHTTHTFSVYNYWGEGVDGYHYHEEYCSNCNGKMATRTKCRYAPLDSFRTCMYCGHSPYLM